MPHSKHKEVFFNTHEQYGTMSCSYGKIMEYSSTRELKLKIKLYMKVCKFPLNEAEVRKPKVKSITLKEVLQCSSDRNKKIYE